MCRLPLCGFSINEDMCFFTVLYVFFNATSVFFSTIHAASNSMLYYLLNVQLLHTCSKNWCFRWNQLNIQSKRCTLTSKSLVIHLSPKGLWPKRYNMQLSIYVVKAWEQWYNAGVFWTCLKNLNCSQFLLKPVTPKISWENQYWRTRTNLWESEPPGSK